MELDVVLLSRIQFAFTIMFHYLYPPLSIGLGLLLVIMEGTYLKTGNPVYEAMTKFWVKIFALTFGLGVASGIVMEFEFGTNWATYSRFVGDIFGSALAAEGIFAFFLESGFLAVLVFGWNKVSPKMHFFSTVMVALGSTFSAVWIVIANNWQQIPTGYDLVVRDPQTGVTIRRLAEGDFLPEMVVNTPVRAEIISFWDVVFNYTKDYAGLIRLTHVILGCYILAAFVVMSVCAWYILKNRHLEFAKRGFVLALVMAAISSVAQLVAGHFSAEIVAKHQPAKLAALEGVYTTEEATPLWLFGWPDSAAGEVKYGIGVPGGLSFLVHRDFKTPVTGLDQFPEEDRPPVMIPFQSYHIMIGLGMYFIGITLFGLFMLWRGKLFSSRWLMWIFVLSVFLPYIANHLGWVAAEVGRQPWIVYGLLRTSDGVSKAVGAEAVLASLIMFTVVYALLFALYIYLFDKKIKGGPDLAMAEAAAQPGPGNTSVLDAAATRGPGRHRMMDEAGSDVSEERDEPKN